MTEEDESSETNRSRVSKRHHDRKVVLSKQLSDLICPFFMSNYIKDLQSAFDQCMYIVMYSYKLMLFIIYVMTFSLQSKLFDESASDRFQVVDH